MLKFLGWLAVFVAAAFALVTIIFWIIPAIIVAIIFFSLYGLNAFVKK